MDGFYNGPKLFKCFEGMVLGVNFSSLYIVYAFRGSVFCVYISMS